MDIISIVNTMQPGSISRFALNLTDIPDGERNSAIAFMGGYAVPFPGAKLPAESAVTAYAPTYAANLSTAQAAATAVTQAADPATQIAHLTSALITAGVITPDALPDAQIAAVNDKLTALGVTTISVSATLSSAKIG